MIKTKNTEYKTSVFDVEMNITHNRRSISRLLLVASSTYFSCEIKDRAKKTIENLKNTNSLYSRIVYEVGNVGRRNQKEFDIIYGNVMRGSK